MCESVYAVTDLNTQVDRLTLTYIHAYISG
jgi:hypothetical protein